MRIHIIAVGNRMPAWVDQAYREYARRLRAGVRLELREIPAARRTKGADVAQVLRDEGARCLAAVPAGARLIALERTGRPRATDEIASAMRAWMQEGREPALLIGGPEGLSAECQGRAEELWSLSALTLPHPLVRVLLAEQLYRAWSIINRQPYHRE